MANGAPMPPIAQTMSQIMLHKVRWSPKGDTLTLVGKDFKDTQAPNIKTLNRNTLEISAN